VNLEKQPSEKLINQGWPKPSKAFDAGKLHRVYIYMHAVKSNARMSMEKAKHGGKKGAKAAAKGAKKAPAEEEKAGVENCALFVALEYPEWQKAVLETLHSFEFVDNKI